MLLAYLSGRLTIAVLVLRVRPYLLLLLLVFVVNVRQIDTKKDLLGSLRPIDVDALSLLHFELFE